MRAVVQRVTRAEVRAEGTRVGAIGPGLLVLVGVAGTDTVADARALAAKIGGLRIFADPAGRMNLAVDAAGGGVLVVSQFTLYGDASRGRRPSFVAAADPAVAEPLVEAVVEALRTTGLDVATGVFGARMEVDLVNDGPVTLILESTGGRVV